MTTLLKDNEYLYKLSGLESAAIVQPRCIRCGEAFDGWIATENHHNMHHETCHEEFLKRKIRLKGYLPSMPAVLYVLKALGCSEIERETINADNPKWIEDIVTMKIDFVTKLRLLEAYAKAWLPKKELPLVSNQLLKALQSADLMGCDNFTIIKFIKNNICQTES